MDTEPSAGRGSVSGRRGERCRDRSLRALSLDLAVAWLRDRGVLVSCAVSASLPS